MAAGEGIGADDSPRSAVLAAVGTDRECLGDDVVGATAHDLETAEAMVRDGVLAIGGRLLAAGVAARGTGKDGPRRPCTCGADATCEGYRAKQVQTVGGWITIRRAYYHWAHCGQGRCPLDAVLGLDRDSHSPGVRRLACRFGARQPFAQAADDLAAAARVRLSASTVRSLTEAVGAQREREVAAAIAAAWAEGLPVAPGGPPERQYVAMDGVCVLGADGGGHEVKVGRVQPARRGQGVAGASQLRGGTGTARRLRATLGAGSPSAGRRRGRTDRRAGGWGGLDLGPGGGTLPHRRPHCRLVSRQ